MSDRTVAAVLAGRRIYVPRSGGVDGPLSHSETFGHPTSERCCRGPRQRFGRELLGKHLRDFADFEVGRHRSEVAVEFDVMRGEFSHLRRSNAHDTVVGVQQFPGTSVQRQLQVLEQASHVSQSRRILVRPGHGLEITYHHEALG